MALTRLKFNPGVNTQITQTQNRSGWSLSNLIRWRDGGLLEKIGGWLRLMETKAAGIVRALHAWEDLSGTNDMLLGTDAGAQIYDGTNLLSFSYARKYTNSSTTTITAISGQLTASIHDINHGATVGEIVTLVCTTSFGGRMYIGGTQFPIASISSVDDYVITLPSANLATRTGECPVATNTFNTGVGTFPISIRANNHGLSAGNLFAFQFPIDGTKTLYNVNIVIPVGNVTVTSIINADYFRINLNYTVKVAGVFGFYEPTNQPIPAIPLSYGGIIPPTSENWFLDNFGQIGLINFTDGPIYQFTPPATLAPLASGVENSPQINTGMFVGMPQAQIIAFGSEVAGVQDPMLVRWCTTSDMTDWTASATNQAGSARLSRGSRIVGGIQAPQSGLLWTDVGLWTMQYTGPPFIYNFFEVGAGCGLIAPKAQAVLNSTVFWMGTSQFYFFDGGGIHDLPCDVWDYVYNDLDLSNVSKVHAGSNSNFNEVFFFFPSITDGTGECSRYVKMTVLAGGRVWDTGMLRRSAWMDSSVFGNAIGADLNLRLQQHDIGYDDDDVAMAGVYALSGYGDMSDGGDIMEAKEIIPDMKWFGDTPGAIWVTLNSVMYPQGAVHSKGPYGMDMANEHISPRIRGRQISLLLEWVERKGYSARFGDWRMRTSGSGKRP